MIIYDLKVFLQFLGRVSYPPNFFGRQGAESLEDAEARASMLELTVELSASGICVGIWKMVSNRVTYMPFTRFYKSMYIYTYIS